MISQLVTCPACGGTGQQEVEYGPPDVFAPRGRFKKRLRPCLACKRSGQLEADRVCLTCGKFVDMCVCPRDRDVEVRRVEMPKITVTWVEQQKAYRVLSHHDGRPEHLAQFADKDMADQMAREAERLAVDAYPALRKKYKELRKAQRQGGAISEDVQLVHNQAKPDAQPNPTIAWNAIVAEEAVQDRFLGLVREALAADATLRKLREAARLACDDASTAEQVAIEAWNAVLEELRDLGGADSAFNRSEFGSILLAEMGHG